MRLRWLHLPHCGPLRDLGVRFGQEGMLYGWSAEDPGKRKGAINFVVGVNGTGKSTLLRAIYRGLRALGQGRPPPLPLTLAWDRRIGAETVTAIFHLDGQGEGRSFFTALSQCPAGLDSDPWAALVAAIADTEGDYQGHRVERGNDAWTGSYVQAHLPRRLIAYTTGAEPLWAELEHPAFRPDWDAAEEAEADDRPPGWTLQREWNEQAPLRLSTAALGFVSDKPYKPPPLPLVIDFRTPDWEAGILDAQRYAAQIQQGLARATRPDSASAARYATRICPADLRLAAIALALWQAAHELYARQTESELKVWRQECSEHPSQSEDPARRILNVLDWLLPTHLSLVYRAEKDQIDPGQRDQLGCLLALAETVAAQPLGRYRAVIPLGSQGFDAFVGQLDQRFPSLFVGTSRETIAERIAKCHSGAEAVIRVFSDALEPTLLEVFEALRAWQAAGLLEEATLTVTRLRRVTASDGKPDDAIVTFDQLSDGEQMLLGRVALLHLVRGQDGALLLLDEPETHFNDVWKRELIDLIDDVILKETFAQVLVSTHTSLALTDVFKSEIVLLRKDDESGRFYEADEPIETFGATPEDILRHVFEADEIIGRRAAQILDVVLIVTALEDVAAPLWASGELTAESVAPLWEEARRVPHAFARVEGLAQFLKAIWRWTKAQTGGAAPPRIVDTLTAIERKLGPGHYQFEFRRRILAHRRRADAAPN